MEVQISKVAGYLLILAGCSGLGFWYSMQMCLRIRHIREMIRILDFMKSEVTYNHSILPDCCEWIMEKTEDPYRRIFQRICEQYQRDCGEGFDHICGLALQEGLEKEPLKEEKEIFIRCFSDIGYGDPWMQQQQIERAKRELQEILNTEEEDVKKRSKLAVSLGTMSGILLVLILL